MRLAATAFALVLTRRLCEGDDGGGARGLALSGRGLVVPSLLGAHLDAGEVLGVDGVGLYLADDLAGSGDEGLLDVLGCHGAGLDEHEVVLLGELEALLCGDLALIFEIDLVTHEYEHNLLRRKLPRVLQPDGQVAERLAPRDVIHKKCRCGASVVTPRDGAERLLSCCVPYLQVHSFSVHVNHFRPKSKQRRKKKKKKKKKVTGWWLVGGEKK